MNVLIAEDEKDIRNLLKLNFEQEGYVVFAAQDGIEALELIQNKSISIDLIILDPLLSELILLLYITKISHRLISKELLSLLLLSFYFTLI